MGNYDPCKEKLLDFVHGRINICIGKKTSGSEQKTSEENVDFSKRDDRRRSNVEKPASRNRIKTYSDDDRASLNRLSERENRPKAENPSVFTHSPKFRTEKTDNLPPASVIPEGRIALTQQPPIAPLCWFTGVADAISLTNKGNIDLQKRVSKNMDVHFNGEGTIHISKRELEQTVKMLKESGTPGDSRVVAMELAVAKLKGSASEDYPEEAFRLLTGKAPNVYGPSVSSQDKEKILQNIRLHKGKYAAVASFHLNWHGLDTHHIYAIGKVENDNVVLIDPNKINQPKIVPIDSFIGDLSRLYSMDMDK